MCVICFIAPARRALIVSGNTPAWIDRHIRGKYISAVCVSAPPWVSRKDFLPAMALVKELTLQTGQQHVLDHIIPVNHPNVCGLTVPWNIQVITWKANSVKGNRFTPDQMELF